MRYERCELGVWGFGDEYEYGPYSPILVRVVANPKMGK